jgi:hypothetical protein
LRDEIKRNRVFVLGAGFSAAAGIPLTSPLLEKSMNKFSIECPGIYSRVNGYAKESTGHYKEPIDYSKASFSEICTFLEYIELSEFGGGERWSNTGSRVKKALRFYLAKTIVEHTPSDDEIPELYIEFAKQLHDSDIVLSFNWDGLLELALNKISKKYTYNFEEDDAIRLCKLHGSINWRLGKPNDLGTIVDSLNWKSLNFTEGMMETEIYQTPMLLSFDNWMPFSPLREVDPFLVLPGFGKAYDVRYNAVLWYKPDFAFAFTHDVFIIGLSLTQDDFFIRSFFLSCLPSINSFTGIQGRHIFIINPDDKAKMNYDFVLSKGQASLLNEEFSSSHLTLMKDRLSNA